MRKSQEFYSILKQALRCGRKELYRSNSL